MLASLIQDSPAARDHITSSMVYRAARAEVSKRKREAAEEVKRKRAREISEMGPFIDYLDFAFKTQGCVVSYGIPSKFRRSEKHPRMFTCDTYKLLSLENVNYMKAHGIEHVVVVQKGSYLLPAWWEETGMSFHQIPLMNESGESRCRGLMERYPDDCILVASRV